MTPIIHTSPTAGPAEMLAARAARAAEVETVRATQAAVREEMGLGKGRVVTAEMALALAAAATGATGATWARAAMAGVVEGSVEMEELAVTAEVPAGTVEKAAMEERARRRMAREETVGPVGTAAADPMVAWEGPEVMAAQEQGVEAEGMVETAGRGLEDAQAGAPGRGVHPEAVRGGQVEMAVMVRQEVTAGPAEIRRPALVGMVETVVIATAGRTAIQAMEELVEAVRQQV